MPRLSDRLQRQAAARVLTATHVAEAKYVRRLKAIMREVHAAYMSYLTPHLADVAMKKDAKLTKQTEGLDLLSVHVVTQIRKHVPHAFDEMADKVKKANAKASVQLIGIKPSDTRITPAIAAARDKNIALVENAARVYAEQVREVFDDPSNHGLRVEELKAKLLERGNVSESRAELIARDQTLKLNGQINQIRQTNAGVTSYIWSTSKDDRVRESHAEKEGERFDWSSPPLDTGHPGQDFQCRCVALPVIEELEGI